MRRSCLSLGITYINTWHVRLYVAPQLIHDPMKYTKCGELTANYIISAVIVISYFCCCVGSNFCGGNCCMCFSEVDNCTTPSAKLKRSLLPNKVTLTEMAGNKTGSGSGNTYCNNYLVVIEHSSALYHLLLRRWIGWWYSYRRSWTVWNIPRILLSNKNWTRPSSVFKTQTNSNRSADLSTRVHLPRPTLITFFLQIHSFTAT